MNSLRGHSLLGSRSRRREAATASEDGFTLIELLVTMVILPFIVGSLALAIVAVFQLNGGTISRINDASDAQILSTSYENDVHSASEVTLQSAVQCGAGTVSGTELIGLEWGANQSGGFDTVVSYVLTAGASSSSDELVREYCTNGNTTTPTSSQIVSANMSPSLTPDPASVTFTTGGSNAACTGLSQSSFTSGWVDSTCVTGLTLAPSEPEGGSLKYSYSLLAVPTASASSGKTVNATSTSDCGFATPGSGTYASSLCFVDFSSLVPSEAATTASNAYDRTDCANGGQYMTVAVDYTPFTMSFCLQITSVSPTATSYSSLFGTITSCATAASYGAVCPAYLPTYYDPPTSEAFLGNNGFYTGVPGSPALYTTQTASTVDLSFYNLKVEDANGNAATGWELVTGDAESTDGNSQQTEYNIYSTCSSIPAASGTYGFQSCTGPAFKLLPNSPGGTQSADIGNACTYTAATVTGTLFPGTWLTGAGTYSNGTVSNTTNTVECAGDYSSDKTGTVMLEAASPTNLSLQLHGAGLQAAFVGLLLQ